MSSRKFLETKDSRWVFLTYALLFFFSAKIQITGVKSDPSSLTALEFEFVKSNLASKCLHIDHNPFSPQELLCPLLSIPYSLQIANKETKLQRGLFNMKDKIRKQYRTLNQPLPSWLKDPRELNIEFSPFERCSQLQNYQFTMRFNVFRSPEATFLGLHDHIQNTVLSFKSLYWMTLTCRDLFSNNFTMQSISNSLSPLLSCIQPISCRLFFSTPSQIYWVFHRSRDPKEILRTGICEIDPQNGVSRREAHFDSIPYTLNGRPYTVSINDKYPVPSLRFCVIIRRIWRWQKKSRNLSING